MITLRITVVGLFALLGLASFYVAATSLREARFRMGNTRSILLERFWFFAILMAICLWAVLRLCL